MDVPSIIPGPAPCDDRTAVCGPAAAASVEVQQCHSLGLLLGLAGIRLKLEYAFICRRAGPHRQGSSPTPNARLAHVRDCQPFMGASCADWRRWHPRRLQREKGCRGSSLLRPPIRVHSPAHVPLAAGARAAGRRRTCRCDPTRWGGRLCRHARA